MVIFIFLNTHIHCFKKLIYRRPFSHFSFFWCLKLPSAQPEWKYTLTHTKKKLAQEFDLLSKVHFIFLKYEYLLFKKILKVVYIYYFFFFWNCHLRGGREIQKTNKILTYWIFFLTFYLKGISIYYYKKITFWCLFSYFPFFAVLNCHYCCPDGGKKTQNAHRLTIPFRGLGKRRIAN